MEENDKSQGKLSGLNDERFPITVSMKPWERLRAFWGVGTRHKVMAWMKGLKSSSAYKYLEEYGDYGSGRKSDLHRFCDEIEYAVATAEENELIAVQEMADLPRRVFDAALQQRTQAGEQQGVADAELFDELLDVIRVRAHEKPWTEQRREMAEAVAILEQEIKAGDSREQRQRQSVSSVSRIPRRNRATG